MKNETILIISAILGAPFIGILVTNIFNKKKQGAETHNINIGGEISLSQGWKDYASQQKSEKVELEQKIARLEISMKEIEKNYEEMKEHREALYQKSYELSKANKLKEEENIVLKKKVEDLESRVNTLEQELERYHQMEKNIKNVDVHGKVDEVVADITKDIVNNIKL